MTPGTQRFERDSHRDLTVHQAGRHPELTGFEALGAGEGTPEHEAVRTDEANFLDPARFKLMFVRDKIVR